MGLCIVQLSLNLIIFRADHSLQELRAKIFPSKKTKAKAVEAAPSVALPTRRKERSLSSLVVNTPRIPAQTGATGKRTKSAGKKVIASRELTFPIEEPIKPVEDHAGCTSSPETINKIAQNIVKEAKVWSCLCLIYSTISVNKLFMPFIR